MAGIIIAASYNQGAVSQYFIGLANELVRRRHRVIFIADNQKVFDNKSDSNPKFLSWPSKRPVRIQDALFLKTIIKENHPDCVIGNFSSDNICILVSWLNSVPHRWVW